MRIENRKAELAAMQLRNLIEDERGHMDRRAVTDCLLRVFLTKESFGESNSGEENENDAAYVYAQMHSACINMEKFNGDADYFYQIYTALKDLDKDDIIPFLNISSHRRPVRIPESLEERIESFIPEDAQNILITDAFTYEGAFVSLIKKNADKKIVITAHDPDMVKLMSIAYSGYQNVTVRDEHVFRDDVCEASFDFIFSVQRFMPVRPERRRREEFNNETPREVRQFDSLLSSLSEKGTLVTCVPNSFAMEEGRIQRERERIQGLYRIVELSSLPGGMMRGFEIKTTFCVITQGKTENVIFRKYDYVDDPNTRFERPRFENDLEVKDEIVLSADDFYALQSWNIDKAFSTKDEEVANYKYSEVKKTVLREVASTFRGKALPPRGEGPEGPHGPRPEDRPPMDGPRCDDRPPMDRPEGPHGPRPEGRPPMDLRRPEDRPPHHEGECHRPHPCPEERRGFEERPEKHNLIEIKVINLSDISDSGIDYLHLPTIPAAEDRIARHLLKKGDVLISSRGTQLKIAVFDKDDGNYVASSNFNIIRCDQECLRGEYLALFLKSKVGGKIISSLKRGQGLININYNDLLGIEVPVPPIEKQNEVVSKYIAGLKAYQEKISKAQEEWNEIIEAVNANLY